MYLGVSFLLNDNIHDYMMLDILEIQPSWVSQSFYFVDVYFVYLFI